MLIKFISLVFGFAVLAPSFCLLSVPYIFSVPLAALVVALLARSRDRWAIATVVLTVMLILGVAELALHLIWPSAIYYRDHEMFARGDHYEPNVSLSGFHQPYGDLIAISNFSNPTITEPRIVDFFTDSLGNRNDQDYAGERYVLIGDSYGVGTGTTQSETLSAALSRELGERVYNASYTGGPVDYIPWRVRLEKQIGKAPKTIFLFFEGNDLPCPEDDWSKVAPPEVPWYLDVPTWIKPSASYKFFYSLSRRAIALVGASEKNSNVMVARVGDKDMGFFNLYLNATRRRSACYWDYLLGPYKEVAGSTALIAMAPDKYRVYHGFIGRDPDLPNARWEFIRRLGEQAGIPTLDLTPALIEEAGRRLPEGKYVYWRDDTHWNGLGTAAAARAIAATLREQSRHPLAGAVSGPKQE